MEFFQVRYFLALTETLNFTRAAEKCNVSQPSLTRAIQNLEAELGGPLFHRERQNTHLTELGRITKPYLQEIFTQAEAAKTQAKNFSNLVDAKINIGVMCTIGPTKLLEVFSTFLAKNGGINLLIKDATAAALSDMLVAGDLDIAILGMPGSIDDRFHALPLFKERFVIGFGPGHPFEDRDAIGINDLDGMHYLSRINCEFAEAIAEMCSQRGVAVSLPYASERDDWIQVMAEAGLGCTLIPEYAVTLSGLLTRPLVDPVIERSIHLVSVRGRPHSPAVGAFIRTAMSLRASLEKKDVPIA